MAHEHGVLSGGRFPCEHLIQSVIEVFHLLSALIVVPVGYVLQVFIKLIVSECQLSRILTPAEWARDDLGHGYAE
jgi:hypothetical protein